MRIALALVAAHWAATSAQETLATVPCSLSADSRAYLATARMQKRERVTLIIAAQPRHAQAVDARVRSREGDIIHRDDEVSYLRVQVPIETVEALAAGRAITAVDVLPTGDPYVHSNQFITRTPAGSSPPASQLPDWDVHRLHLSFDEIYSPSDDMGVAALRRGRPDFDGRGVAVALLDNTPDLLLPELQMATNLNGRSVPKIVAVTTADRPQDIESAAFPGTSQWVDLNREVVSRARRFTVGTATFQAPREGVFAFGEFDATPFLMEDGSKSTSHRYLGGVISLQKPRFAVLLAEKTREIWVDTNQNRAFDEPALRDFSTTRVAGTFGTDDPTTPERETVAFALQLDSTHRRLAFNLGVDYHGTFVVGAALGSRGAKGRFEGIAPGAQLASIAHMGGGFLDGVSAAARDPTIDVIVLEPNWMEMGNALDHRDSATMIVLDRIARRYPKPMVVGAGNFPAFNSPMEYPSGILAVGSHRSRRNFLINSRLRVPQEDNLDTHTSFGPREDGRLGPDVIVPSDVLSTAPGQLPMCSALSVPCGYAFATGTSTAAPMAGAAIALLISAAKQEGIEYDASRINYAVRHSARFVPHIPVYGQGNGVIDVAGAWQLLKALRGRPLPPEIQVHAPLRQGSGASQRESHENLGLFELEGWAPGRGGERTLMLRRTSGPADPQRFLLRWLGNDGTFSARSSSVLLPLNVSVVLRITVSPTEAGPHAAILALCNDAFQADVERIPLTVVAADGLSAQNDYRVSQLIPMQPPWAAQTFVRVPPGMRELQIDLEPMRGRQLLVVLISPEKRLMSSREQWGVGAQSLLVPGPVGGLWQLTLEDTTTDAATSSSAPVKVTITGEPLVDQTPLRPRRTTGLKPP